MSVKLYISSTILDSAKDMITAIDNSDFSVDHIVVVPDKFSLQMENLLLDTLSQKALFNVRVMGMTELAGEILKDEDDNILSSGESLLLTQKAIENVRENLLVLNKSNINFCYEINKIIMQLKSSLVKGNDLNENAKGLAGVKFHDLRLIYNEYESLRKMNDANSRLSLATQKVKNSDVFQNTKIYFACFDAFTKEAYLLLKSLISSAKEVSVSLARTNNIGNDYIYEKDIFQKLVNVASECNVEYSVIEKNKRFFPQKDAIVRGVYSFNEVKCKNDGFYTLLSASSIYEEIESIAKIIYYHITKGYHYKDFAVMLSDIPNYENYIENIFSLFDIPYFIDSSVCADQTILAKTIFEFFNVVLSHYSSQSLKALFSDILLGKEGDKIEKIELFKIDNKFKYKKYIGEENQYDSVFNELEKCENAKDFGDIIRKILDVVRVNFTNLMDDLENRAYLKERNINIQAEEIIVEAIDLIEKYEGKISLSEYIKKLKLILSFKEVLTVPTYVDGIFVGDATSSSLLDTKIIFIVGGEKLPLINSDNGFLSDEELALNFEDKQVQPTIRMINRRNRFRLFNLLSKATQKLILTYQVLNEEGKKNELPSYISSLNRIFDCESIKASELFNFVYSSDSFAALGNRKSFIQNYYFVLDKQIKERLSIEEDLGFVNKNEISHDGEDVFFESKRARVTQLEQYFSCPFKHFVNYGLSLKEKNINEFEVKDIGNVCHRGAELFARELYNKNFDLKINVDEFINQHFCQILEDERLLEKFDSVDEKQSLEKYLKKHLRSLLGDILKEMEVSRFRPKYLEKKFDQLKVGEKQITLVGKVDRIDECGDYFRIIDYKTGNTGNILKELYFGNKLQLFLYQKVAKESFGKRSAGVFYFSAKFDFSKTGEDDKKVLKGLTENDKEVISLLDTQIGINGKSNILAISEAAKKDMYKGSAIAKEKLSVYENYAKKIADKAVNEICDGYIEAKPDEDSCIWCPYSSICKYEKTNGIRKKDKIGDFDCEE